MSIKTELKQFEEELTHLYQSRTDYDQKDIKDKVLTWLTQSYERLQEETLGEVEKLADMHIRQRAIRYPEVIKGFNMAGKEMKELINKLKHENIYNV